MIVYVDDDYKCYVQNNGARREFDVSFFNGKAPYFIESYRFVPHGEHWTRTDGTVFYGEMLAPWRDYSVAAVAQKSYEQAYYRVLNEADAEYHEGVNSI